MPKGNLILVSAPSGAGKSSLVHHALNSIEGLCYSVSYTTRPARGAEQEGIDYRFVNVDEFLSMRDRGEFLEFAEVHGNYYGTNRAAVESLVQAGKDVIFDIDVQGAAQIVRQIPDAVTVFILPPSRSVLESRLRLRRLNTEADLERRLRNAAAEVKHCKEFNYLIVNDDLERAGKALCAIILAERHRDWRMEDVANEIITTFGG